MRTFWNQAEIDTLRQNYATKTSSELLALLPNKTASAIQHKASRLELRKSGRFWATEELDILRKNYADCDKEQLLKLLPLKDWTNIRHKKVELCLKKSPILRYHANWKKFVQINHVNLSSGQAGYVAGIVDGEGTFRIVKAYDKRRVQEHVYLAPLLMVTNTDKKLMDFLQNLLKLGRVHTSKPKMEHHKIKYVYNIASVEGCKVIIPQILPYLVIKKPHAEVVMRLIGMKEGKTSGVPTMDEWKLYEEVKRLNARSKPAE